MAKVKIANKVFRLKHQHELKVPNMNDSFKFAAGEEFHIVADVLYMRGVPVVPAIQNIIMSWIQNNPLLFVEDTRNF